MTKKIDIFKKHWQTLLTNYKEPIIDELSNANIDKLINNQENKFTNQLLKTKIETLQSITIKQLQIIAKTRKYNWKLKTHAINCNIGLSK